MRLITDPICIVVGLTVIGLAGIVWASAIGVSYILYEFDHGS